MYKLEKQSLIDCALQMKACRLITLCGGNVCRSFMIVQK